MNIKLGDIKLFLILIFSLYRSQISEQSCTKWTPSLRRMKTSSPTSSHTKTFLTPLKNPDKPISESI